MAYEKISPNSKRREWSNASALTRPEVGKLMSRVQPSAEYLAEGWFNMHFWETKLGKIGETISEKVLETAVFRQKAGKNGNFSRNRLDSDSVIRWFESSYPSQNESCYQKMITALMFFLELL